MDMALLERLVASGESEVLEFKKSTAELQQVGETLCAFLNSGKPGSALVGVTARGRLLGQEVSDATLQEIAGMLRKLEPTAEVTFERVSIGGKRQVLVFQVASQSALIPFAFKGRPYPHGEHHFGDAPRAVSEAADRSDGG